MFGLARTGLASVRALKEGGADVIAWDDNSRRARCRPSGRRRDHALARMGMGEYRRLDPQPRRAAHPSPAA